MYAAGQSILLLSSSLALICFRVLLCGLGGGGGGGALNASAPPPNGMESGLNC